MVIQILHLQLTALLLTICTDALSANLLSVRTGGVNSTLGGGIAAGVNYEKITNESQFGLVSDVLFKESKSDDYKRQDIQANIGADLQFSKYLSMILNVGALSNQYNIRNEFAEIKARTNSVGTSVGLTSRWTFGKGFYFGMDWFSIFIPLYTVVDEFSLDEKLKISSSEKMRISRSFYRAETLGYGLAFSPRLGWAF